MNFTIKIPGLEDVWITKVEKMEDRIALHVEMAVKYISVPAVVKGLRKFMITGSKRSNI